MWVVPVKEVLKMAGRLPRHQELKQQRLLSLRESVDAWVIFVSHQWLGRSHPDPKGDQLKVPQGGI